MTQSNNIGETVYSRLLAIDAELDHHESDLYVRLTPESLRIVVDSGLAFSCFYSNIQPPHRWLEVVGAWDPFWIEKHKAKGVTS